jgi:HAD superfamily phosphoserine phosphatase-like hydrolase
VYNLSGRTRIYIYRKILEIKKVCRGVFLDNAETAVTKPKGLVVFDVEGILYPKRRFIPFEATRKLGLLKFLKTIFLGFLYEIGLLSLETALKQIYKYFEGYTIEQLHYYFEKIPLLPGSDAIFEYLHKNGWKTALISAGIPHSFIQEIATKLKADYAFGLKMESVKGKFTGKVEGDVIKKNGKAVVLQEILNRENLDSKNCILVADDRNNLQMFAYANLKIGYNPDFVLTAKSDYVVTGNLTNILPIITKRKREEYKENLSRNQILRLAIHMSGFAIPFVCTYFLDRYLAAILIFIVTSLYVISELTRMVRITFPILTSITTRAAVKLELYEFTTAPIFYAFGIILSLIIFPPHFGYASIAILTLGDGAASLFGKKFGKTRYPFNKAKNLEGSFFGFIFAFSGAVFFVDPVSALLAAMMGMLVECLPMPVNDNLTIPLTAGSILMMLSI